MDDLKFEGKDGKEAEDFVTAVKKTALKQGKHQDPEWTAALASTCFYGAALRWLEELDDPTQSDWKLLRRAILQQWPAGTSSSGSSLPTSAAAPPSTIRNIAVPSTPSKPLSAFACIYCQAQLRPVDEDFCGSGCWARAAASAPQLIQLDAADPIHVEVSTLFRLGWQSQGKSCPAVKNIFKIIVKPTLMEYYYAYRRAVEEQGRFVTKGLNPGNERRIWMGVRRSCNLGADSTATRPCNKANCEICKGIKDSFEIPRTGLEWLPFGAAIRGTTVSSKADDYSVNGSAPQVNLKALLLCSVVMGEVFVSHRRLTSVPAGFQSISGEPGPSSDFNFNDTAVYNKDAIRPAFLVVYNAP